MPELNRVLIRIRLPRGHHDLEAFKQVAETNEWRIDAASLLENSAISQGEKAHELIFSVLVRFASRRAALTEAEQEVRYGLDGIVQYELLDLACVRTALGAQGIARSMWTRHDKSPRGRLGKWVEKTGFYDANLKIYRAPDVDLNLEEGSIWDSPLARESGWPAGRQELRHTYSPPKNVQQKIGVLPWWERVRELLWYLGLCVGGIAGGWVSMLPQNWLVRTGLGLTFFLAALGVSTHLRKKWGQGWLSALISSALFVLLGSFTASRFHHPGDEWKSFGIAGAVIWGFAGSFFAIQLDAVRKHLKTFLAGFLSIALISPWVPGLLWESYANGMGIPGGTLSVTAEMRFEIAYKYTLALLILFAALLSLFGWSHYFRLTPFVGDVWMRAISGTVVLAVGVVYALAGLIGAIKEADDAPVKVFQAAVRGESISRFSGIELHWMCLRQTGSATPSLDMTHPYLVVPTQDSRLWAWDFSKVKHGAKTSNSTPPEGAVLRSLPAPAMLMQVVDDGKHPCLIPDSKK